jgi:ABC-2 type transport system permease protein
LFLLNAIRSFTNVLSGFFSMALSFLAAVLLFNFPVSQANVPGAFVSLILLLFSTWSISMFLSVFFAWSRISGHFVEYLEMPVAIICGFMYPIRVLPGWMQSISTGIPIRWALEAMNESLLGLTNLTYLLNHWGSAVLLSFVYLSVTFLLQKKVHDLIRINGELSAI